MTETNGTKMRICVIGAGAAGLCAGRHLADNQMFEFDIYEQTERVGGIWNYTDSVGLDENGLAIHTSMYRDMKTNLPLEIMEFQDFKSNSETSFVSHTEVLKYLEDYTKHFGLYKYIKFNHKIIRVSRHENVWKVIIKNIKTDEVIEQIYESIFVCNGRYSKPYVPKDLKGIERFKGKVMHSHDYRVPEIFEGQTVLILGAGPSGLDISIEISEYAKQIVLNHLKGESISGLPNNVRQELTPIKEISETEVEFEAGNRQQIDSIIFGTGYCYDFSFLDQNCAINVNKHNRVEGIYLHLVNTTHPSMAVWALTMRVIPFPLYHQQVLFFIKCLTREVLLPTKREMEMDVQNDLKLRESLGLSERYAHNMIGNLFFDYSDKLAEMANIKPFRPVVKQLFKDLDVIRKQDLIGYKNMVFDIKSDQEYAIKK